MWKKRKQNSEYQFKEKNEVDLLELQQEYQSFLDQIEGYCKSFSDEKLDRNSDGKTKKLSFCHGIRTMRQKKIHADSERKWKILRNLVEEKLCLIENELKQP